MRPSTSPGARSRVTDSNKSACPGSLPPTSSDIDATVASRPYVYVHDSLDVTSSPLVETNMTRVNEHLQLVPGLQRKEVAVKKLGWLLGPWVIASCAFPRPADVPGDDAPGSTDCQLTAIEPSLANTGDTIMIEGTFVDAVTVNFPGGTSVAATVLGSHRASVTVPASATAGDLTVTTCGSRVGPLPFRRASFPLGLGTFEANLNQSENARRNAQLVTARDSHTVAVVGGYVYVLGGVSSDGLLSSVEQAMINADGTLGSFATVSEVSLVTARRAHTTTIIGGYVYVVGGFGGRALNNIERAAVRSDGSLGPFTTVQDVTLVSARQGHTSAIIGNYLYVFGGFDGTVLETVERATINADGSLGAFAIASGVSLSMSRYGHTTVIVGNYVYVIGGTGPNGPLADVERAVIKPDGSLGAFEISAGATLNTARTDHTSAVLGTSLYVVGGAGAGSTLTDVEQSTINIDGSLGAFVSVPGVPLTTSRRGHAAAVVENCLYVFGGSGSTSLRSIERATINRSGLLAPLTTSPTVTLPTGHFGHATVTIGRYIYIIGRTSVAGDSIERTTVNPDGSLGAFTTPAGLSQVIPRQGHTLAVIGRYLYVVGGDGLVPNAGDQSSVERAQINPDGSLGPFAVVNGVTLMTARSGHTNVIIGNYLYVIGGISGNATLTSVERAVINQDDSLGPFVSIFGLTLARPSHGHATAVIENYIYVFGGIDAGPVYLNDVQRATVNADATLGDFMSMPSMAVSHYGQSCAPIGGYLYILDDGVARMVERAMINADGSLAPFVSGTGITLMDRYGGAKTPIVGNYMYVIGGLGVGDDGFPSGLRLIGWEQLQ